MSRRTVSLAILVLFCHIVLLPHTGAFLFNDEFIDEESGREDRLKIREEFSQEEVEELNIDAEEDLLLSEIKDIAFIMSLAFAGVILISLVAAIKMVSTSAVIIGLGFALLTALVAGSIYAAESTMIIELITEGDDDFWKGRSALSFNLSNMDDLGKPDFSSAEDSRLINKLMLDIKIDDELIRNSTLYRWKTDPYEREVYMIEFINNVAARTFKENIFEKRSTERLRRYEIEYGMISSPDRLYKRGFVMREDRFLFIIFGTEMHSLYAANGILNHFPERYWIGDNTPPELDVSAPEKKTEENVIKIAFSDGESGINPMSLNITNIQHRTDQLKDCRKIRGIEYDSFECTFEDVLKEGNGSITIIISDNEMNNVKKNIEYELITE